jgi:hypothetical protein
VSKPVHINDLYPTQPARDKADHATDMLDMSLSMHDYIVKWEEVYFANGGKVGKRVKI